MKKIRIISLILATLMIVFAFASCNNKKDDNTTSSTTASSQTDKPSGPEYLADPIEIKINFDGVSKTEDIVVPEDFIVNTDKNVTYDNGAVKIGHDESKTDKNGIFNVVDEFLTINENYDRITITVKMTIDKLPEDGQISLISPMYEGGPYTTIDAAGKATEHDAGPHWQFFLKMDKEGNLFYYDPARWAQPCLDTNNNPIKLEEGKTYEVKAEYCVADGPDKGKYVVSIDGQTIKSFVLEYTYKKDDTTKFYIRFGDGNGNYKLTFDDICIIATPQKK